MCALLSDVQQCHALLAARSINSEHFTVCVRELIPAYCLHICRWLTNAAHLSDEVQQPCVGHALIVCALQGVVPTCMCRQ